MSTRGTKRTLDALQDDAEGEFECVKCADSLVGRDFFELVDGRPDSSAGCSHRMCSVCFTEIQSHLSSTIKICCGGRDCSYASKAWAVHPFDVGRSRRRPPKRLELPVPSTTSEKRMHPILNYHHRPDDFKQKYSVLSLATGNPEKPGSTNCFVAHLRAGKDNHELDREDLNGLGAIGRALHPCLVPGPDHDLYSDACQAFADETSILELEQQDDTPLRQFLHGVATGESFVQEENRKAYQQKEYNAVFTAADLCRTAKGGGPRGSKLKDIMSNHLNASNAGAHIKKLVSWIGLSRSKTYLSLSQDRAVSEKIKAGWDPKGRGYGIVVGAYDNIGFRKRTGYVQFVLMCILFFSVETLIKMKIYPDPKNKNYEEAKEQCLSRQRLDWEEVKHLEYGQEGYFEHRITKEDSQTLARKSVQQQLSQESAADSTYEDLEEVDF